MQTIHSFTVRERVLNMAGVIAVAGLLVGLLTGCAHCKWCGDMRCEKASAMSAQRAVINTAGLKTLMATGTKMIVLDARTGQYDDGMRIPGALSLDPAATIDDAVKVIPAKDTLVVTYCANLKCPASGKLAARLKELGYTNVIEYPQGIEGWMKAGNEVKKVK